MDLKGPRVRVWSEMEDVPQTCLYKKYPDPLSTQTYDLQLQYKYTYIYVYIYGGFPEWGYSQIVQVMRQF